jgi:hypothetical protein
MSGYPKLLWKNGQETTVRSEQEESDRRAEGFLGHGETAPEAPPARGAADGDDGTEATFGPSHDDTHARRSTAGSKKK